MINVETKSDLVSEKLLPKQQRQSTAGYGTTTIFPTIIGCTLQKYENSPTFVNLVKDEFATEKSRIVEEVNSIRKRISKEKERGRKIDIQITTLERKEEELKRTWKIIRKKRCPRGGCQGTERQESKIG